MVSSTENKDSEKKLDMKKWKQQLMIATTLSIMFGLGWGFGLPATQALHTAAGRDAFSIAFIVLTAFQGLFIFIMRCTRMPEIIKQWKGWLSCATRKNSASGSPSISNKAHHFRSSTTSTTPLTMLSQGTSTASRIAKHNSNSASINYESSMELYHNKHESNTPKQGLAKSGITSRLSTLQQKPSSIPETVTEKEEAIELANIEGLEEAGAETTFKIPPEVIFNENCEAFEQLCMKEEANHDLEKGNFFTVPAMPLSIPNASFDTAMSETNGEITILKNPMIAGNEDTNL